MKHLTKKLEKEQSKPKEGTRKELIKINAEINEFKNKKSRISKSKIWLFVNTQ